MDKININIPTKTYEESQIINYCHNSNRINRSSIDNNDIFEYISNDKSINDYNSSFNLEEKIKKLNPIKFNFHRKIEIKKPKLNDIPHFFLNKSTEEKINKNSSILQLSGNFEEDKNGILSPKINRIPSKLRAKSSIFNIRIKNNNINNNISQINKIKRQKSDFPFHDLGKDFLNKNKYFIDFMNRHKHEIIDTRKKMEKKDWENVEEEENKNNCDKYKKEDFTMEKKDIKIEQLAKDLNLFQNDEHFPNINFKKNNSYTNLLNNLNMSEENTSSFISSINKYINFNDNFSPSSKMSTRLPSSRICSGKIINNFNNININKFNFDKNKIRDIIKKRKSSYLVLPKEYEYYIEGTNILSPFCEKARDLFLYRKIFFLFDQKKPRKVISRFLNNKLNLCYAENEKQFDEKISKDNIIKKKIGKGKILKVGKSDEEKRSETVNHRVGFIKKIFDYAYPDILIYRIKHKSKLEKDKIIQENKFRNFMKQKLINENLRKKFLFSKKNMLLNSIKIEKV